MIGVMTEHYSNAEIPAFQSDAADAVGLFEPDALLAQTYYDAVNRKAYLEPEKNLMLAVLEDAVLCFQKNIHAKSQKGKVLFRETEEWFMTQEDHGSSLSFEVICETLAIDPSYLRDGLRTWQATKSGRNTHWGAAAATRRGIAA